MFLRPAMQLTDRDFRAMIYYDFKKGLTVTGALQSLSVTFGKIAPSRATVYRLYSDFKRGRAHLESDPRPGRTPITVTEENVRAVERLIREDARITHREIQKTMGVGGSTVDTILHKHLGVHKRCARWVPHCLTEEQKRIRVEWCLQMLDKFDSGRSKATAKIVSGDETWVYQYDPETKQQSSVWMFPDDQIPVKFTKSRSTGKQMVATFMSKSGHVATIPLQDRRTVTADWYVHQCLPQVLEEWNRRRPGTGTRRLMLHHDNAPAHAAFATIDFLATERVQLLSHPPYSPDLAPCDFFLFPFVKKQLRGTRFNSPEDAVRAFTRAIEDIDDVTWSTAWMTWFERMGKCVAAGGEYFEKLA